MASGRSQLVVGEMRSLLEGGTVVGASTKQLLERFVRRQEEVAFEALVARHGPVVLGVCRRVLRDPCDVEDAFQATFLVLLRKAASIGDGDLLETWLYKVATRVALRVRAEVARRRALERPGDVPLEAAGRNILRNTTRDELRPILDEEIKGLPEKYRAPLILFYLQGLSQAETARRLGCPIGTVGSRMARARERLRGRLLRRGLSPSAGLLGIMLSSKEISASVPNALARKTVQAALSAVSSVAPRAGAGAGAASVTAMVAGFLRTMFWARAMRATTLLGGLVVLAIGTAWVPQAIPNKVDTAIVQHNTAGTHLTGPAQGAEPILLGMQTAVPAVDPKAGEPVIDEKTERAIKSGLAWLASQQADDGSFGMGNYKGEIANTSLAAVALMTEGSEPGRGSYRVRVEKALRYVLRSAQPSGFLQVQKPEVTHGPMYHHAFGVLFLSEMYGLSKRPEIRGTLEKAVRLIVETQNQEGGWRYQPVRNDADLSVTICVLNALRAAGRAGLDVPANTINACIRYVKQSQNPDGGFRYMLQAGASAFPRSAAGLLALLGNGGAVSKEASDGVNYLRRYVEETKRGARFSHYFYGHYYAVQAMRLRGGNDWNEWYVTIRDELLRRQNPLGYWPDSIGNDYGTAMALIILQMPKSRLLLYRDKQDTK
jgi:RNA polymerase sigma factor (sigma-70 family)